MTVKQTTRNKSNVVVVAVTEEESKQQQQQQHDQEREHHEEQVTTTISSSPCSPSPSADNNNNNNNNKKKALYRPQQEKKTPSKTATKTTSQAENSNNKKINKQRKKSSFQVTSPLVPEQQQHGSAAPKTSSSCFSSLANTQRKGSSSRPISSTASTTSHRTTRASAIVVLVEHRDTSPNDDRRDERNHTLPLHRNSIASASDDKKKEQDSGADTSTSSTRSDDVEEDNKNSNAVTSSNGAGQGASTAVLQVEGLVPAARMQRHALDSHERGNRDNDLVQHLDNTPADAASGAVCTMNHHKTDVAMSTTAAPQQKEPVSSRETCSSLDQAERQTSLGGASSCCRQDRELPQSSSGGAQGHIGYGSSQKRRGNRYLHSASTSSRGAFRYPPRSNNAYHHPQHQQRHTYYNHSGSSATDAKSYQGKSSVETRVSAKDDPKDSSGVLSPTDLPGTNNVWQNKAYYTNTKRGKFVPRGEGGRHHSHKVRNVNRREMDDQAPVGVVQDEHEQSTSRFVMESSTQTEEAHKEQESVQQEQEETQKVITSNAAGLALLHRLSQGLSHQDEEKENAPCPEEEKMIDSSTLLTCKSQDDESAEDGIDSMEVNASRTTDKSGLTEELAALDMGTNNELDTHDDAHGYANTNDSDAFKNEEQGAEQSIPEEPLLGHEATKECETLAMTEETNAQVTENDAGMDHYCGEENVPSCEQNEFYPQQYAQPWMIYPVMMPSTGYSPPPQEFFYPLPPQQSNIQQPMVFLTAPPYNEYAIAPQMAYGFPPMAYGGYQNPEGAANEEYLLPMDSSTTAVIGNTNMMENRSMVGVPLKYEQVVIGGTVYFNPVYVGDYQNGEKTENMYQECYRDQEQEQEDYYARIEDSSGNKKANKGIVSKTRGKKNKNKKHGTNP